MELLYAICGLKKLGHNAVNIARETGLDHKLLGSMLGLSKKCEQSLVTRGAAGLKALVAAIATAKAGSDDGEMHSVLQTCRASV